MLVFGPPARPMVPTAALALAFSLLAPLPAAALAIATREAKAEVAVHSRRLRGKGVGNVDGDEDAVKGSFARVLSHQQHLRVCNAYPYSAALDVFRGEKEKLTADAPVVYKACQDFQVSLEAGDKLEFKVGDVSAGTFAVNEIPSSGGVLLLVIHRHDTHSTAVTFESHAFAAHAGPQVAVIDTYKGATKATVRIEDAHAEHAAEERPRSEDLRYDSVVGLEPGRYKLSLSGQAKSSELVAVGDENYVVFRAGVEAEQGETYPEELVVFPQSDPALIHSRAASRLPTLTALFAVLCSLVAPSGI